jgi:hypothetical protein
MPASYVNELCPEIWRTLEWFGAPPQFSSELASWFDICLLQIAFDSRRNLTMRRFILAVRFLGVDVIIAAFVMHPGHLPADSAKAVLAAKAASSPQLPIAQEQPLVLAGLDPHGSAQR